MAMGFPLLIDIKGNNCTVFGGGKSALRRVKELLRFGAKVTLVSPEVCSELEQMSTDGIIRHIPRKYFRGDCTNAQLCVAATDDNSLNIAISTDISAAIWTCMGYTVLLCFCLFKTSSLAKSVFNAH